MVELEDGGLGMTTMHTEVCGLWSESPGWRSPADAGPRSSARRQRPRCAGCMEARGKTKTSHGMSRLPAGLDVDGRAGAVK